MKKNNSFERNTIKKQYVTLLVCNMLAFLVIYIILGIVVVFVMDKSFYSDLENDFQLYKSESETRLKVDFNFNERKGDVMIKTTNPRFMVIFYDENKEVINGGYSFNILNYFTEYYDFGDRRMNEVIETEAKKSQLFKLQELNVVKKFENTSLNNSKFNFITLSYKVDSPTAPGIGYCKLLVMVNGEISIRNKVVNVYIIASGVIIILAMIASYLLSRHSIKPIAKSLNKQLLFVGDASHELRTPLSIVQSKLENILTMTDATVMDVSEDIAISLNEVSRLSKLTRDLLTLATSDNNTSNLTLEDCSVTDIVISTASVFKEMAEIDNKSFNIITNEGINAYIDKAKITQLLIILLDNSLKYTNKNDCIELKLYRDTTDFVLEVNDTGIGITEETKKKIFERFYREDKARSRETGGNGLGLAIAKTITLEHNGKIVVDHNLPKGTKFVVTIPCKNKNKK